MSENKPILFDAGLFIGALLQGLTIIGPPSVLTSKGKVNGDTHQERNKNRKKNSLTLPEGRRYRFWYYPPHRF
jgi:hypothetical protein